MKEGWEIKKLGDIGKVSMCKRILKKQTLPQGDIPFFKIGTFGKTANAFISKEVFQEFSSKYSFPKKGDVLLSASGTIGRRVIYDGQPAYFQDSNIVWIDNDEKQVLNSYLYKFYGYCDWNPTKGATISRLYNDDLRKIEIPIPPLPEQQRIVAILDRAFSAIDQAKSNAEQNLQNAKELFESYLQEVFENQGEGWEEKKLKEIGLTQTGNTPKTSEKENYGDYIPFIKPADVDYTGIGDLRCDNNRLSEVGFKKARSMKSGSTLMVCIGATIGKVGFAEHDVTSNQQINSLTVNNEYHPKFFYYAMTSKVFQEKVLSAGKGAQATLPIINKSKWENLTIPFPSLKSEQEYLTERFDALRLETQKLETLYQKKIAALDELKKSVLQKAFQGELKSNKLIDAE